MIKAVIFDMDGTTVDSIKSIAYYANETLKKFGFNEAPLENYFHFVGDGPKVLFERLLDYVKGDKENIDEILKFYMDSYNSNVLYLSEPYEGILKMLRDLKSAGIKLGIVSNKQDVAVKLISDGLFGDLIDAKVGFCENIPKKPAPDLLLSVMKELGVEKSEVLFVGDTNVDIFTAKNANVKSIGVLWGFRDEKELADAGADYIVSTSDQITQIALDK